MVAKYGVSDIQRDEAGLHDDHRPRPAGGEVRWFLSERAERVTSADLLSISALGSKLGHGASFGNAAQTVWDLGRQLRRAESRERPAARNYPASCVTDKLLWQSSLNRQAVPHSQLSVLAPTAQADIGSTTGRKLTRTSLTCAQTGCRLRERMSCARIAAPGRSFQEAACEPRSSNLGSTRSARTLVTPATRCERTPAIALTGAARVPIGNGN